MHRPYLGMEGLALGRLTVRLLALSLSLAAPIACDSRTARDQPSQDLVRRINAYMEPLVQNRDFSGVVRVVQGDRVLFEEAYGFANFENGVSHSLNDRFAIASVSKTFTAAGIEKLRSESRLSYDDLVSRYLPSFAHGDKIRIKHLLRFESGLAEVETQRNLTSAELLDEIGSWPLEFEPGTRSRYGNSGFNVLAILVERVCGTTFEEYLGSNFFDPLKMTSTGLRRSLKDPERFLVTPHVPGPPPNLVLPCSYSNASIEVGAGGLHSTAGDLTKWGLSIARKEIVDIDKEEYPWGWGRTEIGGRKGLEQTGLQPGFTASLQVFPDDGTVIVMLNNIEAGLWTDWAKDIARIMFSRPPLITPERRRHLERPPDGDLEALPGRYRLNAERFVVIRARDGHLWLHLNDYHVGRYMLPLADGGFQLRDFTGRIYFNRSSEGDVDSLTWKLPETWNSADERYLR